MNDDIDRLKRSCRMLEEIFRISEHILKDLDAVENQKIDEGAFDTLWYHSTRIYNMSDNYIQEIRGVKEDLNEKR